MKKCDKCKKDNPQDAKFCMYCGEKLHNCVVVNTDCSLTKEEMERIISWIE